MIKTRKQGQGGTRSSGQGERRGARGRRRRAARERIVDVISQLECATRHPRAAILGGVLGGAIPWFARALAHGEIPEAWTAGHAGLAAIMIVVVLGCAAFSMLTVYKFGKAAFGDARKAAGFVAALEGVMLVSHGTTSLVALALLVIINAIANGCVIALAREATARRQEADGRRSATRAQNRARTRGVGTGATSTRTPAETPVSVPVQASAASARPTARHPRPIRVPVVSGRASGRTSAQPQAALVTRGRWISDAADTGDEEMYS